MPGRLQSGEQRVHHSLALAAVQGGEPASQRLSATLRALGKLGERAKAFNAPLTFRAVSASRTSPVSRAPSALLRPASPSAPSTTHRNTECCSKPRPVACTTSTGMKDPMRMPTMESAGTCLSAARKRLVVSRREQTGFEPGTIVVVQARDALLHLRRRRERRVLGQVARPWNGRPPGASREDANRRPLPPDSGPPSTWASTGAR